MHHQIHLNLKNWLHLFLFDQSRQKMIHKLNYYEAFSSSSLISKIKYNKALEERNIKKRIKKVK